MKKIGIYYGSKTGKTLGVVDEIDFYLRDLPHSLYDVKEGLRDIEKYENLIFVTPTYGVGELQNDWENVRKDLEKLDFENKIVALVGLGNQYAFGESFLGGIRILYDIVNKRGGKLVGFTPIDGFHFEESDAIIDNKFVGLALDEENNGSLTPSRIENWISEVMKEFK